MQGGEHAGGKLLHGFCRLCPAAESCSCLTEASFPPDALVWCSLTIRCLHSEGTSYAHGQKQLPSLWAAGTSEDH